MREKDVALSSKHTSSIEIKVIYNDKEGTSRNKIESFTFDADEIAEVTDCVISFDASDNIVVSATGDEDTVSLHFRCTGNGDTPGTPDGSGSDSGSISGRSGVDTTSVTCAPAGTAKVNIRGSNGVSLGPTVYKEVKREAKEPRLSQVTLFVLDSGGNNTYTVDWAVNNAVSDTTHDVDIDFFENGAYVGSSENITPSDEQEVWVDTGAGDGGADEHYVVVVLKDTNGVLQSITSKVQQSAY
jgi:hypothetical protein